MTKDTIIAGLDLGTSRIKCVVAVRHEDGQVDVIGTGTHPAKGLRNGGVCNPEDAARSIRAAVEEAELMAGCEINEVFLAISGRHLESFNSYGMVRVEGETIAASDLERVVDMARAVRLPADQAILHVVPQSYVIDGQPGISRPLGMSGVRLEVAAHVILGHQEPIQQIEACCRDAGLQVVDVLLAPLAQAEVVLTPQSKDLGVVLVDIGGDTTDIAVFVEGSLQHTAVLPVGGEHITLDIKKCLNTPTVEAEHLKQTHGAVLDEDMDLDAVVEVPGVGGRRPRHIKRHALCEIIDARVDEILKLVADELQQVGYPEGLPGGVVFTGGAANLQGLCELAERVLDMPATLGGPKGLNGLSDVVQNPRYATACGLVVCGINQRHMMWYGRQKNVVPRKGIFSMFQRLFSR
ncbi:MAG: cell division protein FtsA [Myxococcales bacterium]|nr:cell division protein FtsA [Myxococcales bacterium]MCB9523284.1 cell division protein FtsA [Myxococcales bacterium]